MARVLNSQYENDLTFVVDYLVDLDTYKPWKSRLYQQILNTVEVPGFRKGKAPEHLALKQLNEHAVLDTIARETVMKFGDLALQEAKVELEKTNRVVSNQNIVLDHEVTKETDEGFVFRLVLDLLPQIDLSPIDKIKKPEVKPDDLPERITVEDFVAREKSKFFASFNEFEHSHDSITKQSRVVLDLVETPKGQNPNTLENRVFTLGSFELPPEFEENLLGLKEGDTKEFNLKLQTGRPGNKTQEASYKITVKEVMQPKYMTLSEVFENSKEAEQQFKKETDFQEFLEKFYDQETVSITNDATRRKIIQETVDKVSDFSLPSDRVEAEQNRILKALQTQTESTGETLGEALISSGIARDIKKVLTDQIEIKKQIDEYVVREFKWLYILRAIYELKVEPKITSQEAEQVVAEMAKNPVQYGITKDTTPEQVREIAFDRLMRSKATNWLFELVEGKN